MSGRRDYCRDHPLICHWRPLNPATIDVLNLPTVNKASAATRDLIITEALVIGRADRDAWISYSRRREWYVSGRRYRPAIFRYSTVVPSVDQLAAAGLFEHQ